MKRLLLIALAVLSFAHAEDKKPEYTEAEKASIEKQYKEAMRSYQDDKKTANAILVLSNYFTSDERFVKAYNEKYNMDATRFNKLRKFQARMLDMSKELDVFKTLYRNCKSMGSDVTFVWAGFYDYASTQDQRTLDSYLRAKEKFLDSRSKCKQELNKPEPKPTDFEPNECDIPGKCAIL